MAKQTNPAQTVSRQRRLETERRAWIRFPSDAGISSQPLTPSKNELDTGWLGTVRDVSPVGIRLAMSQRCERGTALIVELSAESNEGLRLPVRVVHATQEANGQWIIGCELARELSPQELTIFLGG
jgi:PilZ domain